MSTQIGIVLWAESENQGHSTFLESDNSLFDFFLGRNSNPMNSHPADGLLTFVMI